VVFALVSVGSFGLLAIPSGNLVEPAEASSYSSFAGGNGTIQNPYQISNVTQLQNMSANLSAHYMLVNDINASVTSGWNLGAGFDPIGDNTNRFTGSLDGQDARQKAHSSYSFPSITYLSLPAHSAAVYSPAYTGTYMSVNGSRTTRMRDLAGLLLLYFGAA